MSEIFKKFIKSEIQNKVLILSSIIFIAITILFIIISVKIPISFFHDCSDIFFKNIYIILTNNNDSIYMFKEMPIPHPRYFSYIFSKIIFIFLYSPLITLYNNFQIYAFSLLTSPFLLLILNFFIALRTRRFDIATLAFLFFCFFDIPYINWVSRETYVSTIIQFTFLQYYLSKEKINKIDLIIMLIITLFVFESFENMVLLSIIFVGFGYLYLFKYGYKKQLLLGMLSVLAAFHIGIKTILVMLETFIYFNNVPTWGFATRELINATFNSNFVISIAGIVIFLILMFMKRTLQKKDIIWMSLVIFISVVFLFCKTHFIPNPPLENSLFLYSMIILPVIFFILILSDYFGKKISSYVIKNILILACIIGSFQICWQINSAIYRKNYIDKIQYALEIAQKPFVFLNINDELRNTKYPYDITLGLITRSVLCNKSNKIKSIVIINPNNSNYVDCGLNYSSTYYDEKNEILYLNHVPILVNKVNMDFSPIIDTFKNLGLTKSYEDNEFLELIRENVETIDITD